MIDMKKATTRTLIAVAITSISVLTACGKKKEQSVPIQTEAVERRDIIVTTEGTGTVEPVDTVAVKSQASGLIMKMPVEVGTYVKPGDLIAQIDTRNLQNDYTRAVAAAQAAESTVVANAAALRRAEELYKQGVITAVEYESAVVSNANARSSLVAAQTNLRVAQQNLEFATVRAEVSGTIISKSASVGTVAASALSNVGGGSTLVTIADLSQVRMRVLVNETDIAQVRVGQAADVQIDALPNRRFRGTVQKIEPQAVIQQSVTMFPVLVSIENTDQALLPGMNGEVSMVIQDRRNVLSVPIDALRSRSQLASVASGLGISNEALQAVLQGSGPGGGMPARNSGAGQGSTSAGLASGDAQRTRANGNGQGRRQRGTPSGRSFGNNGTMANGGPGAVQNGAPDTSQVGTTGAGRRGQVLFAFVKEGTTFVPRRVRIGVTNFDYAEVLEGLNEGEQVALLSLAAAQGDRNASTERARRMTGGGIPGAPGGAGPRR
jgi:HlyD family secretion protein